MSEASKIAIRIENEHGAALKKFRFSSPREFTLVFFDKEGRLRSLGSLPLKMVHRPLQQWAEDWVKRQDIAVLEDTLQSYWLGTVESFLNSMKAKAVEVKAYFQEECGKRGGALAFLIVIAMIKAVKRKLSAIRIHWKVESLPDNGGIYRILLEAGKDDES